MWSKVNRTSSPPTGHTGDRCTKTGQYVAGHCTPRFERTFQEADQFTECRHGNLTSWDSSDRDGLTRASVSTSVALALRTIGALFLIWPETAGPEFLRSAHVPLLYEARNQSNGILLMFGSQAMLLFIMTTRSPMRVLAVWAVISAAALPFAAELYRLDQGTPTQNLVALCSCSPVFIRILGHVPTGKSKVEALSWLLLYSVLGIVIVAVIVNTKVGPILTVVFGQDVVAGTIFLVILGVVIVVPTVIFLLVGAARGRIQASGV